MAADSVQVFTDYVGRAVRLTQEPRAHILEHPEMAGQLERIGGTLAEPETVIATEADQAVHVYYRYYEDTPVTGKFLLVVAKVLADDSFVLTAFLSSRQKKGTVVWER